MPHVGTYIPANIKNKMTPEGLEINDTDWYLEELYDFLKEMDVSILIATHSRYVIDLNRDLKNQSLYPGEDVTGLVPTTTFNKKPIYKPEFDLRAVDIVDRHQYWRPYHKKLSNEIKRLKEKFVVSVLWDAHSIRSEVPRFFEGQLPDFNFGTNSGDTETLGLSQKLVAKVESNGKYSAVENGRFKGGYITRNYGDPTNGIHSVQLELSQKTYMKEHSPFVYEETLTTDIKTLLKELILTTLTMR